MDLKEEITDLINSKCEGSYWDFKEQWPPKDGGTLLHDIICMANNLDNRDAFIIVGVEDKTFKIKGINKEDQNRKNTQQLNDYLKSAHFAGNVRPLADVKELVLEDKTVDVIVVKRSDRTPFYLTKVKKEENGIRPYHIYTRIQDTNTAKDISADPDKAEILWKKRFGIGLTATDRFRDLIKEKDKWKKSPYLPNQSQYIETWYHEKFPEFTIKISNDEGWKAQELYMYEFPDPTPHWMNISICYNNTALSFFKGVGLDGLRYTVVAPYTYIVLNREIEGHPLIFYYYLMDSLEVNISNVLGGLSFNSNNPSKSGALLPAKSILYFKNLDECDLFREKYLETNRGKGKLTNADKKEIEAQSLDNFFLPNDVYNRDILQVIAKFSFWCQKKLTEFRNSNSEHDL